MKRRTFLAGVGGTGAAVVGGGAYLVNTLLTNHDATPVAVERAARSETGYDETELDDIVIERSVGIGGFSRDVVVTNYLTEHEKAIDMGPLGEQRGAVFVALSTPQVSTAGQELNPVADMSTLELVDLVQENYDDMENVTHLEDDTETILDQETTVSRFTADATFQGSSVDVYVHVSEAVETDDDLVVTIGVYPQTVVDTEGSNIRELMRNITTDLGESDVASDDEGGSDDDDETDDGTDGEESTADDSGDGSSDGDSEDDDDGLVDI